MKVKIRSSGLNESFLNKDSKKYHNIYLKINISRDMEGNRSKNDVIGDVIGNKKVVKIQKFLVHLKEEHLLNKKYYYEKA